MSLVRTYWLSALTTLLIWAAVAVLMGVTGFVAVVTLTVLEVTFSFDNAVVNSKLLGTMSMFWQKLFMTVGILVAVGAVRFALPIGIVAITAGLSFGDVISLALHNPDAYAAELAKAGGMIDAFGGTFLLMIATAYFLDAEKNKHWIKWLEKRLAPLGRYDNISIFAMVLVAIATYFLVGGSINERAVILVAAISGIALHVGLDLFGKIADGSEDDEEPEETKPPAKKLVGVAAAVMFLRLEVLDASFSFDGVVGAFAITTSVLLIMAGLGAGAMWVRSMTVHLVRQGTLAKYAYLEHGAHWAIFFLGIVLIAKLYELELPEWLTGSIGLVFILAAVISSKAEQRKVKQLVTS